LPGWALTAANEKAPPVPTFWEPPAFHVVRKVEGLNQPHETPAPFAPAPAYVSTEPLSG
jgi:hypothetical protein